MVLVSKEKERAMNLRISFAVEKNDMVEVLFGMFQSSIYEKRGESIFDFLNMYKCVCCFVPEFQIVNRSEANDRNVYFSI